MIQKDIDDIAAWLVARGLAGMSESELLHAFCQRCRAAGMPLSRALTLIDTLHPVYEGRAFRWRDDGVPEESVVEYGRTDEGAAAENWQTTTFHHLLTTGNMHLRRRLAEGHPLDFGILPKLKAEGYTDYFALVHPFEGAGSLGAMDCFYSHWISSHEDGLSNDHLHALKRLVPLLALAVKCASLGRIARTLVEVYLGRDAGGRVLGGRIRRGVAEKIRTVLWFSDLRGFTAITDSAAPAEIIPLLNDYAELVISAVHAAGGDVLKLIGDGTLAIFNAEDPGKACRKALLAASAMRAGLLGLNARRAAEGRPVSEVYLGLHFGEVFYGNIGSDERLDFTVVGPAVNEASRIASMCRSVDRGVLVSSQFHAATPPAERADFVSVGRFALRGVGRAQELFTLDPALVGSSDESVPGSEGR